MFLSVLPVPFSSSSLPLSLLLHSRSLHRHVCHSACRCCLQGSQDPLRQGNPPLTILRLVSDQEKEPFVQLSLSTVGSKPRPSSLLPCISLDRNALYGLSGYCRHAWHLQCQEERQRKDFSIPCSTCQGVTFGTSMDTTNGADMDRKETKMNPRAKDMAWNELSRSQSTNG